MTKDLNERRIKALTGAFDRAIQTMIANANAAGWSTDEALAAIDGVVAQLKMNNAIDPDPADDPEPDQDAEQVIAVEERDQAEDEPSPITGDENEPHLSDDGEDLPASAAMGGILAHGEPDAAREMAGRPVNE
jgi:hypothetical protein